VRSLKRRSSLRKVGKEGGSMRKNSRMNRSIGSRSKYCNRSWNVNRSSADDRSVFGRRLESKKCKVAEEELLLKARFAS